MEEKIGVLGAGGWGITLACLLNRAGVRITLWEPLSENYISLKRDRENKEYFPGVKIPESVVITNSLEEALTNSGAIILVVRSVFFRETVKRIKKIYRGQPVIIGTKGIEIKTGKRMSGILTEILSEDISFGILSGPTIARELAEGRPSAAVVATTEKRLGLTFQEMLSCDILRVYTSDDVIGVETGGAFKNIIAIGSGMIDGLGLGINTKSSYLTRGLNEMINIGRALGGKEKTFRGLSGIGDLITTSFSRYSRNRSFGEGIIKTDKEKYLKNHRMVIEGIPTTKAFYKLSKKMNIELPITASLYRIIYNNVKPEVEIKKLMQRKTKEE
jgi:glycerol-3-phosphate dehydrogenase (NAD(P)+)